MFRPLQVHIRMKRRALLTAIGSGGVTLSGCLTLGDGGTPDLVLGRIEIVNYGSEAVSLDVEVKRAGESMYEETIAFDPVDDGGEYPSVDSTFIIEDWMGDPAEYEVSMAAVDHDLQASNSTSETIEHFQEYGPDVNDGDCFAWYSEIGYFPTRELDAIRLGNEWIDPERDILEYSCA